MRKLVFPTVSRYPSTQPPLLGPRSYSRPVDGVSAGHAGAGYGSRLSWQYRGLL